jgi:hypothetical protein
MHFQKFLSVHGLIFSKRQEQGIFEIPKKDGTNDGTINGRFFHEFIGPEKGQYENAMM